MKELGLEPVLMEDNASIHASKMSREWREAAGITSLVWPPCSPDLNPDENMWGAMKQRIKHTREIPQSEAKMFELAQEEWNRLREDLHFQKWIGEMRSRLREVIKMKGYATRY